MTQSFQSRTNRFFGVNGVYTGSNSSTVNIKLPRYCGQTVILRSNPNVVYTKVSGLLCNRNTSFQKWWTASPVVL